MSAPFLEGDWVLVWGQIVGGPTHPEDALVEFFSHNEQWSGHVELSRLEIPDVLPEFANQCLSLRQIDPNVYARCESHERHGGNHHSGQHFWTPDGQTEVVGR